MVTAVELLLLLLVSWRLAPPQLVRAGLLGVEAAEVEVEVVDVRRERVNTDIKDVSEIMGSRADGLSCIHGCLLEWPCCRINVTRILAM